MKIRRFLAPPVFESEEKTRIAALLNVILLSSLALAVIYGFFAPLIHTDPQPIMAGIGVEVMLLLGLRHLMRRGHVQLVCLLITSVLWLILTIAALFSGGVSTLAFVSYFSIILIAGLLLGGRASFGFAGLSILSGFVLLYIESVGLLPASLYPTTPTIFWGALAANFILAAVLLHLATRSVADALERAQQSEAKAKKAQAQLVDAIESLTEAFALYDEDDRLVLFNSKYREFYDLSEDLLVPGIRFEDHIQASAKRGQIADALGREEAWVRERLKQHQNPQGMYVQQLGNGRWLQINERMTSEGGIVGVRTDITERVQAEEALKQSEQYFRSLIENALDIITILNRNGSIRFESPSIERVLGYQPGEVVGRSVFEYVHPDDLPKVKKALTRRSKIVGPAPPVELRYRHKDGSWRILEAVGTDLLEDPIVAGIVINSRDITERKQLEEQFLQSQKMEALGQLTAGIAHDFNNLLTAINGFAGVMQYKLPQDDPNQESLEKILDSGQRAADLVRQLLVFSRKQIIEPKTLDLNIHVTEMDKMLRRIIGENIALTTRLAPDLWLVKADPTQIEQVVVNLAINARDAMTEGGRLTIETANVLLDEEYLSNHLDTQRGNYVLLAISDTGPGITEEVKTHIFEPFFTTKEQGKGTGLGLATVFGIVKQHGGYIWVYSELGTGTTFKIYLPRAKEGLPASYNIENIEIEAAMPSGSETILLVEDDPEVRNLVQQVLQSQGYTVLEAAEGQEALRLAAQYTDPINLLLTDVIMPGMNGKVLADQLLQLRSDLKVLYISGYTDDAIAHHGVLAPGVYLLQKPFGPVALARKVRNVLDS